MSDLKAYKVQNHRNLELIILIQLMSSKKCVALYVNIENVFQVAIYVFIVQTWLIMYSIAKIDKKMCKSLFRDYSRWKQ